MSKNAEEPIFQEILEYRCPRYEQFPAIPLYNDQVVELLNHYTAPLRTGTEHAITAAMINNYVKQKLIPPPVKKRYDQGQVARLYCICLLKQVFSIADVGALMTVQTKSYPFPQAYNYFCTELESALQATISTRDFSSPSHASQVTPESELVRSAALSFANKLFSTKFLALYPFPPKQS